MVGVDDTASCKPDTTPLGAVAGDGATPEDVAGVGVGVVVGVGVGGGGVKVRTSWARREGSGYPILLAAATDEPHRSSHTHTHTHSPGRQQTRGVLGGWWSHGEQLIWSTVRLGRGSVPVYTSPAARSRLHSLHLDH